MLHPLIHLLIVVALAVWASIKTRKLTVAGAVGGGVLAVALFVGIGWWGLLLLGAFFVLGTLATSWRVGTKVQLGLAEKEKGRRTLGQVWANGGVAGAAGLLALIVPAYHHLWVLMAAGSLATATADTLSSELGSVYGTRFYNCITFKRDQRGLDGVISVEGLLIGILGSAIIAALYCTGFGWRIAGLIVVLAGTIGNLADSVLGATLERKGVLSNNMVNFLNTLVGALAAMGLYAAVHLY